MVGEPATAPLVGGIALLERALGYTYGSLQLITPEAMTRSTPCRDWDLRALLAHMNDSLAALHEAADIGVVDVADVDFGDPRQDPVATLRNRGCAMLGDWTHVTGRQPVSVSGRQVTAPVVATTGAVEITVHGWDVAQACGSPRPIPTALAEELLPLASLLVTDADRPATFASEVIVSPASAPDVRLLAFLGRSAVRN